MASNFRYSPLLGTPLLHVVPAIVAATLLSTVCLSTALGTIQHAHGQERITISDDTLAESESAPANAAPDRAAAPRPDASPSSAPAVVASPISSPRVAPPSADLLALQIDFAESALQLSPTLPNRGRVISLYERALAAACPAKQARCAQLIERLLQLDTGNMPAVCQKFTLASPECKEVSAAQENGWYDVDAVRWRTLSGVDGGDLDSADLANAIQLKQAKPRIDKLIAERESLIRIPRRETAQELALDKVLGDGIALTCTGPKIVFLARDSEAPAILGIQNTEKRPKPAVANPLQLSGSLRLPDESLTGILNRPTIAADESVVPAVRTLTTASPLDSVISGLNALPTPTARPLPTSPPPSRISAPIDERLRRIRLVSAQCYEFVRIALSLRPNMVTAHCAYHGWYAPACRAAPVIDSGVRGSAGMQSSDGIASF